ncbi:MAG: hypothetical protein LBI64_06940 [Coriobacteriales bacterium]|jgi:hypothetical protein|nr:hypothetical protein [Coriobacteriales bacterium]
MPAPPLLQKISPKSERKKLSDQVLEHNAKIEEKRDAYSKDTAQLDKRVKRLRRKAQNETNLLTLFGTLCFVGLAIFGILFLACLLFGLIASAPFPYTHETGFICLGLLIGAIVLYGLDAMRRKSLSIQASTDNDQLERIKTQIGDTRSLDQELWAFDQRYSDKGNYWVRD